MKKLVDFDYKTLTHFTGEYLVAIQVNSNWTTNTKTVDATLYRNDKFIVSLFSVDNQILLAQAIERFAPGQRGGYTDHYQEIYILNGRRYYTFDPDGNPGLLDLTNRFLLHEMAEEFYGWQDANEYDEEE